MKLGKFRILELLELEQISGGHLVQAQAPSLFLNY